MERLQAVLAVAVASAVLAYSGVSGVTAGSASGVNVSSLLLSRVAKRAYRFVSVGDQKHFWAWEVGEKGVYVVDTAGTILNSGKPLLPDSRPFAVTPAGDHIHALVSALPGSREQDPKKGGLLVVGRSPEESKDRSLLPEGDSAESVFITDKGAWVRSPLSGLYFLDQSLTPRRVNDSLSSKIVSTKNGILVSGREWVHQQNSIVSHGLDVSLLKPSGALTKITSENLLPKAAGDADLVATIVDLPQESEVWFFPRLHHGIHILNVDDAVKSRDGNYKAIDLFANSDMYVRFTADGGAWAFPINSDRSFSDRDDLEKGAYLLERERLEKGLSPDPIPSLSDVVVQEIVPLSATTALVQGVFGGKTRVAFVSRSGETAVLDDSFLLRHGSPVPSAPQVFHEEDGPDYFILTETGELLRFDVDKRKLEVLSRSYASIFEQGKTGIWMVVPDLSSPSRGVSFYDFSKKRITKGPFFQQAPLMPNFSFEEGGDRGLVASEPFGTFLFECDRKSLPIEVTLGKTRFSLEAPQTLPDVISFDPNGPEIDATLELGQSFAKRLTPGSQVSIEISWGVNKQHRVFETPDLSNSASAHRFHVAEEVGGRVPLNSPIKFAVSFRDSLGSKVAYE